MRKPILALVAAALLIAAPAQAEDQAPARANIEDRKGDANGFNDQGFEEQAGFMGDEAQGPSYAPADIRRVWFTNTDSTVTVHVITAEPPTDSDVATMLRVASNKGCLVFEVIFPGINFDSSRDRATVRTPLREGCGGTTSAAGSVGVARIYGGQGLTTMTFPMFSHPSLVPGGWFLSPSARTSLVTGAWSPGLWIAGPVIDNTRRGLSYRIEMPPPTSVGTPPVVTPANPPDETPVKNGCKKNPDRGEKKGCKKDGD